MKLVGLTARIVFNDNGDKLPLNAFLAELRESTGNPRGNPWCPSGVPYFICDPSNYTDAEAEKVFAYCRSHSNVIFGDGSIRQCDKAKFKSLIPSQLFNTHDVGVVLCKAAAAVATSYAGVYLCQSPASALRLEADKSAGMMINGSGFKGSWIWSISAGQDTIEIVFLPEVGAPSRFSISTDGSLRDVKYGYEFKKVSR